MCRDFFLAKYVAVLDNLVTRIATMARAASILAFFLPAIASAPSGPVPTFTKDVAPILFKNCVSCHRPGEIAQDISLVSYEAAKPWADSIKKTVMKREMPPWP